VLIHEGDMRAVVIVERSVLAFRRGTDACISGPGKLSLPDDLLTTPCSDALHRSTSQALHTRTVIRWLRC
jgi:hypothetical protein